jgi:hypothetical protein
MGILPKDKHIGHLNYIDMENIIGGMTGHIFKIHDFQGQKRF